jgi:hypothetical protein
MSPQTRTVDRVEGVLSGTLHRCFQMRVTRGTTLHQATRMWQKGLSQSGDGQALGYVDGPRW